ncbi:MAG: P-II family nitrogen regulator [Proteobacteria bacterium]|nr:P-II family nitrogen regulator [Pseudomonadota bacterium]
MKEILAIIRMNMMGKTKDALIEAGVVSMNAVACLGRGKGLVNLSLLEGAEKGYEEAITQLGQGGKLIPKRSISIILPDKLVKKAVETIIRVNKTGKSGDGKIFVMPAMDSIRIRTGETGQSTLDGS